VKEKAPQKFRALPRIRFQAAVRRGKGRGEGGFRHSSGGLGKRGEGGKEGSLHLLLKFNPEEEREGGKGMERKESRYGGKVFHRLRHFPRRIMDEKEGGGHPAVCSPRSLRRKEGNERGEKQWERVRAPGR